MIGARIDRGNSVMWSEFVTSNLSKHAQAKAQNGIDSKKPSAAKNVTSREVVIFSHFIGNEYCGSVATLSL